MKRDANRFRPHAPGVLLVVAEPTQERGKESGRAPPPDPDLKGVSSIEVCVLRSKAHTLVRTQVRKHMLQVKLNT